MAAKTICLAGLVTFTLMLPIGFLVVLSGAAMTSSAPTCQTVQDTRVGATGVDLDAGQVQIAEQVIAAVRAFPPTADTPHAAVVALATAGQESGLRNLDHGDRDSLGVFQQRPSEGWGTPVQVMNVAHATTTFLQHIVQVPGWVTRPVTDVAAQVQRPAASLQGAYQQWVPMAETLTRQLWAQSTSLLPESPSCPDAGRPNLHPGPGDTSEIVRADSWVDEQVPYSQTSYHTNHYGTYRQDCSGYVSMAWGLSTSFTTYTLPSIAHPITKSRLRAGDIMLKPGHTLLFDTWANPDHSAYWAYEEQHPGTVAVHHVVPYPYWPGQGVFTPYRKDS